MEAAGVLSHFIMAGCQTQRMLLDTSWLDTQYLGRNLAYETCCKHHPIAQLFEAARLGKERPEFPLPHRTTWHSATPTSFHVGVRKTEYFATVILSCSLLDVHHAAQQTLKLWSFPRAAQVGIPVVYCSRPGPVSLHCYLMFVLVLEGA